MKIVSGNLQKGLVPLPRPMVMERPGGKEPPIRTDTTGSRRRHGRPGALGEAVWPILVFASLTLLVIQLSRAGIVMWQLERVRATGALPAVLLQGLRFDLAAIGMVLLVPGLVVPWLLAFHSTWRAGRLALRGTLLVMLFFFSFMELATPSFLAEFDARPNFLFVEYLRYPTEVLSMLWGAYPAQLLLTLAAGPWVIVAVSRWSRGVDALAGPLRLRKAAVLSLGLASVCLLAARSSLDHRPVNPSAACVSTDAMVNTLGLNSSYSLGYAIYELRRHESGEVSYGSLPEDEVLRIVRNSSGVAAEAFLPAEIPTLHRQQATRHTDRPLNLVIVLEESLGAEFVGAMGGVPLTPHLDRLLDEGLTFNRLYATGTRSVRGIEAVLTGFFPTPSRAVVKLPRAQRGFFTLAELLRDHGYATSFIYGGDAGFDNMRRFLTGNGFETIIDGDSFQKPYFAGSWGVSDQDLFRRAHAEFEALGQHAFFSLVFTTSNHTPWDYPTGEIEPYEQPAATRHNAVKYADHALGEFISLARASSYWERTVILVVADHNSRVYGPDLVPVDRFHVPAVFLGSSIEPEQVNTVASQVDLLPTALSLIGLDTVHPALGRDLTDAAQRRLPGRALLQFHQNFLYLEGDRAVVLRQSQPPAHFIWNGRELAFRPAGSGDLERRALAHALWPQMSYREGSYRLPRMGRVVAGPSDRDDDERVQKPATPSG